METYLQARKRIMVDLVNQGWVAGISKIPARGRRPILVPHATSPDGRIRLTLHDRRIDYSTEHPFNSRRQLYSDYRETHVNDLLEQLPETWEVALIRILSALMLNGWTVGATHTPHIPYTLYATRPNQTLRLWFYPNRVWYTLGDLSDLSKRYHLTDDIRNRTVITLLSYLPHPSIEAP